MRKKLTITVDAEVYDGLHTVIGHGRISRFLAAMAADETREREAEAWIEGLSTRPPCP